MDNLHIAEYCGREFTKFKYGDSFIISISELANVLDIKKSDPNVMTVDIPDEQIVPVPLDKKRKVYYLKREGVITFIKKYKPEDLEKFMLAFDSEDNHNVTKELKLTDSTDPYAIDLLEDILNKVNKTHEEVQRFYSDAVAMCGRQVVLILEMESLYSKIAAMLLRAESLGPLARINKEFTKDLITLGKEAFNDAMSCEQSLKEYENFGKEQKEKESAGDKEDGNDDSETSRLLIRTGKKRKNSRK